jgi:hypothetical protein
MNMLDIYRRLNQQPLVEELLETNHISQKYGLTLYPVQARDIIQARNQALQDYGRIETDNRIISQIISSFCSSPYLSNENYTNSINELIDIFYFFKNETRDLIADKELLLLMKDLFNDCCCGSLDLLRYRELPSVAAELKQRADGVNNLEREMDNEGRLFR